MQEEEKLLKEIEEDVAKVRCRAPVSTTGAMQASAGAPLTQHPQPGVRRSTLVMSAAVRTLLRPLDRSNRRRATGRAGSVA